MTAVEWVNGRLRFIDQTLLPREERFLETDDHRVVEEAVRTLRIRGAPAIGVAAAYALCLAVADASISSADELRLLFREARALLGAARPTAVNLSAALDRMSGALESALSGGVAHARSRLLAEAHAIRSDDVEACRRIGELGASLLPPGSTVLTHCNAGALATAGSGTALAVITAAARLGGIARVYVDETRPLFQGSRLTAWELVREGIDTVLITDSAAGAVLRSRGVRAVIVGADRIAANGDVANKIGTYPLAVLAARHGVPFYVAAPTSTLDPASSSGDVIPIEERSPEEVTHWAGERIAAEGVRVFAPAFDVTPAGLVTAIITERGILSPPLDRAIAAVVRGDAAPPGTAS